MYRTVTFFFSLCSYWTEFPVCHFKGKNTGRWPSKIGYRGNMFGSRGEGPRWGRTKRSDGNSLLYIQGSVHREIYANNYPTNATTYNLFIFVNRSTCFGWYLHASSGPHVTLSTASGISKTVNATCSERDVSHVHDRLNLRFY